MEKFIQSIQDWFKKLTDGQKRRLILACTVLFAGILTISVLTSLRVPKDEELPGAPDRINFITPIPPEELFLPDEPDYLPGVLLEREQRTSWTVEDASEHWQDPLRFGEEQWREIIEASIDEFFERVP